ncbi:MAG: cell division protein ZapA [Clostridia bacterium]|nr:cell division protein ZapA [Clostridia bacterium]
METNRVKLNISGVDYVINTDNDAAYTKKLGDKIDSDIRLILRSHPRISQVQASVLCTLDYADKYYKAAEENEKLREEIKAYMEDAARSKTEAEIAKREKEKMTKDLKNIKKSLEGKNV